MDDTFEIAEEDPNPSLTLNLQEIKRVVNNLPGYTQAGTGADFFGKAIKLCASGRIPTIRARCSRWRN